MSEGQYVRFESGGQPASYVFLYPASWQIEQVTDDQYVRIFITGPRSTKGTYNVMLGVQVALSTSSTLEDAAAEFLGTPNSIYDYREVGREHGSLSGDPALEIEAVHHVPLPPRSIYSCITVIRERHVFVKRADRLYKLWFTATEEDYQSWLETFRILVRTFSFTDEPAAAAFCPLITPRSITAGESSDEPAAGGQK